MAARCILQDTQLVMVTCLWVSQSSQRCSHLKFWLLLTFILNYELRQRTETHREYYQRDLNFCKDCFQHQQNSCETFFHSIESDSSTYKWRHIIDLLPRDSNRAVSFLQFKNNNETSQKIIAKYVTQQNLDGLSTTTSLKEQFFNSDRLDGLQYCPAKSIERFVDHLKGEFEPNLIWLHFILNVEPLLMPLLEKLGFPVPQTFNVCGFTLYQANIGKSLIYFYNSDFQLKLRIAKQLLEAAVQFSKGFAGFRIYITDLSADNLIVDERTQKLYIVDLDTVLIVDSESKNSSHKHNYIECDNCFAYSQQDICDHGLSDINLFSACQLLREDLNGQREGGFLYPIPNDISASYPNLQRLLDNCVDCFDLECSNRFAAILQLIELIDVILKNFY